MKDSTKQTKTKKQSRSTLKTLAVGAGVALFWLVVWELAARLVAAELLLPSPLKVATTWWGLAKTAAFWKTAGGSLLRVVCGFAAGTLGGTLLAFATVGCAPLRALVAPLLHIVRAAPVASFIILALVWIKTAWLPPVIACLMVLPLVWANVEQGLAETDKKLLEMAAVYRLPKRAVRRHIRLPSLTPYLVSACKTGLGFAWKSSIAAEVICRPDGSVGDGLYCAKLLLETPEVFAWTGTVVLLSVALEKGLLLVANRLNRRHPQKEVAQ